MAKYDKYVEYKDSGVEWIGEIPNHWTTCSLSKLFSIKAGGDVDLRNFSEDQSNEYLYPIYTNANDAKSVYGYSKVANYKANSITVSGRGEVGFAVYRNHAFDAIIRLLVLSPQKKCEPKFFAYFINEVINFRVESSAIGQLSTLQISPYKIVLPSLSEQKSVVDYLDHETAKIDSLIEKQQQLIELLKEKRQAVISHAVTKGLNPDVKMKDSGVEWLGEVPEHWDIVQAKYIADITRGAILRPVDAPEYFDEEGEWAYLNISDATKCDKYLDESKLRLSQLGSTKSARVYPNNLIITASATIGKAFINRIKVCVHDGFIPFCNIKLDINYLYHYVSNPYLYAAMGKSNTQKNIYLDEVKNMMVTVPPRCEQVAIVKHIESSQFKYDGLMQSANSAIKLMQERRTALISAAVTGKIDVRNWQNPNNNNEAKTEFSA